MATILDKILLQKEKEVEKLKQHGLPSINIGSRETVSLYDHLRVASTLSIIAEIKRASPSKGDINPNVIPFLQAALYEKNGAAAISVLTDETFFKGSFTDLAEVRPHVQTPILCKDFIIDEIQIDLAKQAGADVVLLIVAALTQDRLSSLYRYARAKGLDVLVEVHSEAELEAALNIGARIIGANNRNLKTFEVDLAITEKIGRVLHQSDAFFISESGIKTREDVLRVKEAGARGILVGESLMTSGSLEESFQNLTVVV
ncbi:indole-3-glycerol phosphate synthase TrpC [Peribacillus saganii]|uniref:Indole-3-glycerol phosphate synthase n=1 Tax=Peribacillus saganii TaxID=2303992 RepID=A0A372LSE4_9BACI|nr:indole-3-glycerol phosphate synthase TrpC [Peribacillus saganii]RFU71119.1 indole-3-glycerol phosphate synthase TrpC [Peribacillus saganii]